MNVPIPESKGFTSPEQINGKRTIKSDIYSVGKVILEILRLTKIKLNEKYIKIFIEMVIEDQFEKRPNCEQLIERFKQQNIKSYIK